MLLGLCILLLYVNMRCIEQYLIVFFSSLGCQISFKISNLLLILFSSLSKQAQRCYCETPSCSGWIGEDPDKLQDDDRSLKEEKKKKKKRDPFVDVRNAVSIRWCDTYQRINENFILIYLFAVGNCLR